MAHRYDIVVKRSSINCFGMLLKVKYIAFLQAMTSGNRLARGLRLPWPMALRFRRTITINKHIQP